MPGTHSLTCPIFPSRPWQAEATRAELEADRVALEASREQVSKLQVW